MSEEFILHSISNVGVPAIVCLYTLFGVRQSLDKLTNAIDRLSGDLDKRISKLEDAVANLQQQLA